MNKLFKASTLQNSYLVAERKRRELSDDEKCDIEVFSILHGTSDAEELFRYDGQESVVDEDIYYKPYQEEYTFSDYHNYFTKSSSGFCPL